MKRHFYVLPLAAALALPAMGQQSQPAPDQSANPPQQTNMQSTASDQNANAPQNNNGQYATGAPLEGQTHEGFWGHLMPFARKKYVRKQLDPVRSRVNELDELTAKNANDIKDVDARAQQGIQQASARANEADQHAQAANQLATQASQTAQQANTQVQSVQQAVSNIDQYQPVTQADIMFRPGQTKLTQKAKDALDQIASQLQGHSGYILQVQGFSSTRGQAGIASSQSISQAVVRYLVEQHDVPLYRIYTVGMGNAVVKSTSTDAQTTKSARLRGGKVEVSLLKNGVADLSAQNGSSQPSAIGGTQSPAQQQQLGSQQNTQLPQSDNAGAPQQPTQQQQPQQQPQPNANPR